MDVPEKKKGSTKLLNKAMNSARYVYNTASCDLKELYKEVAGEELMKSVGLMLSDFPYHMRRQSQLDNTCHEVVDRSDVDEFCDVAKQMTKTAVHGNMFCSTFHFSAW